jgi:autotransporter-associated beta strand protein
MKLSKLSLFAAAALNACCLWAADINVTGNVTVDALEVQGGDNYVINGNSTLTIDMTESGTMLGKFKGTANNQGTIIKEGASYLEYLGYQQELNEIAENRVGGFYNGMHFISYTPSYLSTLSAFSGSLVVRAGELRVTGYLNQWYSSPMSSFMMGTSSVILEDNARLSFQNTAYNIVNAIPNLPDTNPTDGPFAPLTKRYNIVRNIQALKTDSAGVAIAGEYQVKTVLDTGNLVNSDGKAAGEVIIHIDQAEGSIGILSGKGNITKTGAGNFRILNDADNYYGHATLAGGVTILESINGSALKDAASVNLAGTDSARGLLMGGISRTSGSVTEWIPAYSPAAANSVSDARYSQYKSGLEISTDQSINNLQSRFVGDALPGDSMSYSSAFANAVGSMENAGSNMDTPIVAGTGFGTFIEIHNNTLTVNQEENKDGYYSGSFLSDLDGVFLKKGLGTLALFGPSQEFYGTINIEGGRVIASVQSLGGIKEAADGTIEGYARVHIGDAGRLDIVQNSAGTLAAKLSGNLQSELRITFQDTITTEAGATIVVHELGRAPTDVGTVEIRMQQEEFKGTLIVDEGSRLIFSAGNNDTFVNAAAVVLSSGTTKRESSISFKDTNQLVRNLSGDELTRIELGRGTITLEQNTVGSYSGRITGVGNLIKTGTSDFGLYGQLTYYGATVVKEQSLIIGLANGIANTSGVVLLGGTKLVSANLDQHFGGLFGESGSQLILGTGNLTIGADDNYLKALNAELASLPSSSPSPQAAYYFSTTDTSRLTGFTEDTTKDYLRNYAGVTNEQVIEEMAFAGEIISSGNLTKVGKERLTLSGVSSAFTGAVDIKDGYLRINYDSLPSTTGITIEKNASANTLGALEINSAAGQAGTFSTSITGTGDFYKVGEGDLNITNASYTGNTYVEEGRLILTATSGFPSNSITLGTSSTSGIITFNQPGTSAAIDFTSLITGTGNVEKTGGGTLTLSGSLTYAGTTSALDGTLILKSLPSSGASDLIAQGAGILETALVTPSTLSGTISGDGTFIKSGATLTINSSNPFTGAVIVKDGNLVLNEVDVFGDAKNIQLKDPEGGAASSQLILNNKNQAFHGLAGDSSSKVIMGTTADQQGTANITLDILEGSDHLVYNGTIDGKGEIIKLGLGTASLRGDNRGTYSGRVTINQGILEVTTMALGDGNVVVNIGATLQIYSDSAIDLVSGTNVYDRKIEGVGNLSKTGTGDVYLSWDATSPDFAMPNSVLVSAGKLIVDSARNNHMLPSEVAVNTGATFQINMQGDMTYGGQVKDIKNNQGQSVSRGNFCIDGQLAELGVKHTMTLLATPDYSGLTLLQNGAILDVSQISSLPGGIGADATSELHFGNRPNNIFYITQSQDAEFSGIFSGKTKLELDGAGILKYLGPDGKGDLGPDTGVLGEVTIAGGNLQVGVTNQHTLAIKNGDNGDAGTLYINVLDSEGTDTNPAFYTTAVTGSGNIIKTGAGTMDANQNTYGGTGFVPTMLGVNEGRLLVKADDIPASQLASYKTGILDLVTSQDTTLSTSISGDGFVEKTGAATLTFTDQENFTGTLRINEGKLNGNFSIGGSIENNAYLAPGGSIGTITVGGDFVQGAAGTLEIEIDGTNYDKIIYGNSVSLSGTVLVKTIGAEPVRGEVYRFLQKSDGSADPTQIINAVVTSDDSADINARYLLVGPNVAPGSVYSEIGAQGAAILVAQKDLSKVPGYSQHDGLSSFIDVLNDIAEFAVPTTTPVGSQQQAAFDVGAILNTTGTSQLGAVINNFSPLAFSSMVAMPAAAANAGVEQLHARLEQRRYDRASYTDKSWQAYVTATSNFANNDDGTDDAVYNFNTYGGVVGTDCQVSDTNLFGAALEYTNGKASIHDGGGNIKMNAIRGTGYLSHMVNNWFFIDAGVSGGYLDYDSKRDTATGRNKATPDGWSLGTFATIGTIFPLHQKVHVNPYAGIEYNHYDISGFTESGSSSRLKVDGFGYDSLRAKIGTGLAWFIESGDWDWKLNLDVAYAHEILDTDSDIDAYFAQAGGNKFSVSSKTLASDVLQLGPSITLSFSETMSVYASYRLEIGIDGETYNNINVGFRTRF